MVENYLMMLFNKENKKMANVKKTVAWFIAKKSLIKFQGDDDTYTVAENVLKVIEDKKTTITKGDEVEVEVTEEEVTFMKKEEKAEDKKEEAKEEVKEEPKAEEKKEEVKEPATGDSDTQTFTVEGVFEDKEKIKSVKFKDEKINGKKWTKLSTELGKKEFKDLGLVANNEVTVTIVDGVIVKIGYVKVAEKKEESKTEAKKETKKSSYNSTGSSIERQCAMKGAVEIVKTMLETKALENNKVKEAIVDLTKVCYKAIQEA